MTLHIIVPVYTCSAYAAYRWNHSNLENENMNTERLHVLALAFIHTTTRTIHHLE